MSMCYLILAQVLSWDVTYVIKVDFWDPYALLEVNKYLGNKNECIINVLVGSCKSYYDKWILNLKIKTLELRTGIICKGTQEYLLWFKEQDLPGGVYYFRLTKTVDINILYCVWIWHLTTCSSSLKKYVHFNVLPSILFWSRWGVRLICPFRQKRSSERQVTWLISQSNHVSIYIGIWTGNFHEGATKLSFHSRSRMTSPIP